jgi:hypothetical protein
MSPSRARWKNATGLLSCKSGEPIAQSKHLASDLPYWPVLGLYHVILHADLIEVLRPPPRPYEVALWSSGLALADPLLQRRQRRMEPNDGDRRTRYRLRDEAQVRTLFDKSGQEEPRRADSDEVRPKRREVW